MVKTIVLGQTGSVTLPGSNIGAKLASITVRGGQDVFNVSSYGGNGWNEYAAGLKGLAGSAGGFLAKGTADSNPGFDTISSTTGTMTVTLDVGCVLTFPALLSNIVLSGSYAGLNVITFDYVCSGVPTIAWVTA